MKKSTIFIIMGLVLLTIAIANQTINTNPVEPNQTINANITETVSELVIEQQKTVEMKTTGEDTWKRQTDNSLEESLRVTGPSIGSGQPLMATEDIGLAVGGANDIQNFRQNIKNGFTPSLSDITYEGIFYDYYFEPVDITCEEIFCPTTDGFIKNENKYVSVGLTSGITKEEFSRDGLDLVIVLDVSGSMSSSFDSYYYDVATKNSNVAEHEEEYELAGMSKIEIAKKALIGLVDNLDYRDRLGVVLFERNAHVAKPLEYVADLNKENLKENVSYIIAGGGTNMEDGFKKGLELFDEETFNSKRIIFLTDAIPNVGVSDSFGLAYLTKMAEKDNIHTTMIGVGVDFNTKLIEEITDVRGANYYSVHNAKEFIDRMDEEFSFMVTPLVYDLELFTNIKTEIYGAPGAQDGKIFLIKTLFPSSSNEKGNKGGIIILDAAKSDKPIVLTTTFRTVDDEKHSVEKTVLFDDPTNAIKKAVLLKEYVDLMKEWINSVRGYENPDLESWEKPSSPLTVNSEYFEKIKSFKKYFKEQSVLLNDKSLEQEIKFMEIIEKSYNETDIYENDDENRDTWNKP